MTIEIDKNTASQIHKLSQDLASFIALYEQSDDKFSERQNEIQQNINVFQQNIDEELQQIRACANELAEIITPTGAARFRVNVEKAAKEGQEHVDKISQLTEDFQDAVDKAAARLAHIAKAAEKGMAKAFGSITIEQTELLEQLSREAEKSFANINIATGDVVKKIKRTVKWIRWERLGIAFFAALFTSLLMGLYVNSEWPWESSHRASYERNIGRSVLNVWPSLTPQQREQVQTALGFEKDTL